MYVQSQILDGKYQLVWSYILEYENSMNPYEDRRVSTLKWRSLAATICEQNDGIVARAKAFETNGFRSKDALHISCAIESGADCLLTTDDKMLNKSVDGIELMNPIDFVRKVAQ